MWQKIKAIFPLFIKDKPKKEENYQAHDIFEDKESIFISKFNTSGGKFIFCDNLNEIYTSLFNIIIENQLDYIVCFDKNLQNLLEENKIQYNSTIDVANKEKDFLFIKCENLIQFDGSIMVSSDQIKSYKISELPRNIIFICAHNQITTNLSSALRNIKHEKGNNIPSNITTIKALKSNGFEDLTILKNIYLLMHEELI